MNDDSVENRNSTERQEKQSRSFLNAKLIGIQAQKHVAQLPGIARTAVLARYLLFETH